MLESVLDDERSRKRVRAAMNRLKARVARRPGRWCRRMTSRQGDQRAVEQSRRERRQQRQRTILPLDEAA